MNTEEFIAECLQFHPKLATEPDFEKFVTLLGMREVLNHCRCGTVSPETLADACAQLLPEQREFWLRVEATLKERFMAGFVAMMAWPDAESGEAGR